MATYVIGDVQGCRDELMRLLDRCAFSDEDHLWFTGDLVNRGEDSLGVLRFAMSLGKRCQAVLGNHDLYLLVLAHGLAEPRKQDTLDTVLAAPDLQELLEWLRQRPFILDHEPWLMLHAGILPGWDLTETLDRAEHASAILRSAKGEKMLRHLARREAPDLDARRDRNPVREAAATARILTNLRCCDHKGRPRLDYTGPPEEAGEGLDPWYAHADRRKIDRTIICGHWAAQGLRRTKSMVALDSGCVWGHRLSAFRLEDEALFSEACERRA